MIKNVNFSNIRDGELMSNSVLILTSWVIVQVICTTLGQKNWLSNTGLKEKVHIMKFLGLKKKILSSSMTPKAVPVPVKWLTLTYNLAGL